MCYLLGWSLLHAEGWLPLSWPRLVLCGARGCSFCCLGAGGMSASLVSCCCCKKRAVLHMPPPTHARNPPPQGTANVPPTERLPAGAALPATFGSAEEEVASCRTKRSVGREPLVANKKVQQRSPHPGQEAALLCLLFSIDPQQLAGRGSHNGGAGGLVVVRIWVLPAHERQCVSMCAREALGKPCLMHLTRHRHGSTNPGTNSMQQRKTRAQGSTLPRCCVGS